MSTKQPALHPSFTEFSSVLSEEWAQAAQRSGIPAASSDSIHPGITFSAINTEATLPPPEGSSTVLSEGTSILEVTLAELATSEELVALRQAGVPGVRVAASSVNEVVDSLVALDHPFSHLSLEVGDAPPEQVTHWLNYLRSTEGTTHPVRGTLYLPSAHISARKGSLRAPELLVNLLKEKVRVPGVRLITVMGNTFYEGGASVVDELAMTVSGWVVYCDQLTDAGLAIENVIAHTEVTLATGTDFFLDLAKFRAVRMLLARVAEAYGVSSKEEVRPSVRAVSGVRNKTLYDPDSNLLRTTTEGLTALLGGVDVLSLQAHDFLYSSSGDFGRRTAIQAYHILRQEAHVGRVHDPAAGSYFIEDVTRQLVEQGWKQFLAFEEQGGFHHLLSQGVFEERCQQAATAQAERVATQRQIIVGANRYANPRESITSDYNTVPLRWATPFEKVRYAMDQRVAQGQARPVVPLIIQQDAASAGLINQRVNYVKDVLTSVGLAYEEYPLGSEKEFATSEVIKAHPPGIIFCGTNAFYESTVVTVCKQNTVSNVLVAGGSQATQEALHQAGGKGVLGIGHPVVSLLTPLTKEPNDEA